MLQHLRRNIQFGQAIPKIQQFSILPETHLPGIWARAKWKHREIVGERMQTRLKTDVIFCPGPDELLIHGEQRYSMMTVPHFFIDFQIELYSDRVEKSY